MKLSSILRDRRIWLAIGFIAILAVIQFSGFGHFLSLDTLRLHRESLAAFVAGNFVLAAVVYVLIYTAAVAFSVPGAVFLTLSGGFLFGAFPGTLLTVTGATLGASLVFLFARSLFGERALDRFGESASRIAAGIRKNAIPYLLVLRLVPLFPFFLVNLVPAFAGVGLATFAATTFVGIIPATVVFSLAGAGLSSILDQGGAISVRAILTPQILAGLTGLALLSLLSIPLKKWLSRSEFRS